MQLLSSFVIIKLFRVKGLVYGARLLNEHQVHSNTESMLLRV